MADDITLTVNVRDMTRGDFERLRRRLNGLDDGVRRVGDSAGNTSEEMDRLSQGVRGVEGRMRDLQQTGGSTREDMAHMRRSMGLLNRELRRAAREGDLTEEQFRRLSGQLERTRLDFDHLNNDVERHSAIANRAHREEQARRREAENERRRAAREEQARNRRVAQDNLIAARRRAADDERAAREAFAQRMAAIRRQQQADAAALRREEAERRDAARRQIAEAQRQAREEERAVREASALRMAAIQRRHREEAAERRRAEQERRADENRMRGIGGGDIDRVVRFRSLGNDDLNRLHTALYRLEDGFADVNSTSAQTQRRMQGLTRDMSAVSRVLTEAGRTGVLTRRDLNALSGSLTLASQGARQLRRDGEISRATFRGMTNDITSLRAQLLLLGGEGSGIDRMNARLRLFQMRLREVDDNAGGMRRSLRRMGDWGLSGAVAATTAIGFLTARLMAMMRAANLGRRALLYLKLTMLLVGPAAQALGVLLITALGGAFIALGAFALRGAADVRSAFTEMKETVSSVVKEAAQPMRDDLVRGIQQVGEAAQEMQPMLTVAFSAAGPLIDNLFGGITDLFAHALPGFASALKNSEQAMGGFRTAMGLLGKGFGQMFEIITNGNEDELEAAWITLGEELRNLLQSLGEFISTALNSETATAMLVLIFRTATGALNALAFALESVDGLLGGLFRSITDKISSMDKFKGAAEGIGSAFDTSGKSVEEMRARLAEIKSETEGMGDKWDMLAKPAREANPEWQRYNALLAEAGVLESAIEAATAAAAEEQQNQIKTIQQLYDEMFKLTEAMRGSLDSRAALEKSFDDGMEAASKFAGELKVVNGEFDMSTEAARGAWEQLSGVIGATKGATEAAIEAKKPWSEIEAQWMDGRDKLVELAGQLGVSAEGVRILTEEILGVPDKTAWLRGNKDDLENKLKIAREKLKTLPDSRKAKALADIAQLEQAIGEAKRLLATLDGQVANTYVYTNYIVTGSTGEARKRNNKTPGSMARGGVIGAASGGPRSRMTMVGEHGPELVDLSPGSRVYSNPDTRRMVDAAHGGGGGGGGGVIAIQLNIGDKYLGEVLVDPIRKAVRTRGGNVQAVLGQRGS